MLSNKEMLQTQYYIIKIYSSLVEVFNIVKCYHIGDNTHGYNVHSRT